MLKEARIERSAQYLCNLTESLLIEIQQSSISHYSRGRLNKDPNEGDIVKGAARGLIAIDKLCELCDFEGSTEKQQKKLDEFKSSLKTKKRGGNTLEEDHVVRYGFNRWSKAINDESIHSTKEDITLRLEGIVNSTSTPLTGIIDQLRVIKEELINKDKIISNFIGDLLDYPRVVVFDLPKAVPLTQEQKSLSKEKQHEIQLNSMKQHFDPEEHKLKIEEGLLFVERTDNESLFNAIERHYKFTNKAFSHLDESLEKTDKKDNIYKKFIEETVLKKQQWSKGKYDNDDLERYHLDVEYITQNVSTSQVSRSAVESRERE